VYTTVSMALTGSPDIATSERSLRRRRRALKKRVV